VEQGHNYALESPPAVAWDRVGRGIGSARLDKAIALVKRYWRRGSSGRASSWQAQS
jgi:hypothetical protein